MLRVMEALPTSRPLETTEDHPRPSARELVAVLEHLSDVLQPQPAHDWLFTPNPMMDHYKPVDLLRAGEPRKVLGAIDALAENVFV
jgi:uncharacterized protein (DUF2384 family)